jgi:hypothetical protein
MRHTATILIGQDLKLLAARLGKYVLKYGEGDASSYFTSLTWSCKEGITEIKKAVRDGGAAFDFVSTMQDQYHTKLEELETLKDPDRVLDMRHFFQNQHQRTVTINNPGDSNSLLISLVIPLYDAQACEEAIRIIGATSSIQSRYTVMIVGLCENLGSIISPEEFRHITAVEEVKKKAVQKQMLKRFADMKLEQNALEQIVVMQNTNSDGFALNLDQDSLLRIIGELSLLCVEKYNTIFTQAGIFDREHLASALGLSDAGFLLLLLRPLPLFDFVPSDFFPLSPACLLLLPPFLAAAAFTEPDSFASALEASSFSAFGLSAAGFLLLLLRLLPLFAFALSDFLFSPAGSLLAP